MNNSFEKELNDLIKSRQQHLNRFNRFIEMNCCTPSDEKLIENSFISGEINAFELVIELYKNIKQKFLTVN